MLVLTVCETVLSGPLSGSGVSVERDVRVVRCDAQIWPRYRITLIHSQASQYGARAVLAITAWSAPFQARPL